MLILDIQFLLCRRCAIKLTYALIRFLYLKVNQINQKHLIITRAIQKMQPNVVTNLFSSNKPRFNFSTNNSYSYEAAIEALNGLQSNAEYLKNARKAPSTHAREYSNTILQVQKYLIRSGITLEQLDKLSVIHVTGTKGKGSTCAFCESILRHHGYSTGFFSSPHLLEVRERIRIDGKPLSKDVFSEYFWELYNVLYEKKESTYDMPSYFRFLTILAFRVFLSKKVDVAIIEVGIGGEFDCTNVLRKVPVVGITSLDLDHTSLLGDTIEKITWHKAGILKENCKGFTVPQAEDALILIKNRSIEKNCTLQVINTNYIEEVKTIMHYPAEIIGLNAALSIALSEAWCRCRGNLPNTIDFKTSPATKKGLKSCFWPGRFQVLYTGSVTYYIDGAHTAESLKLCASWFLERTKSSSNKKVLIFNATGDRNSIKLLSILHNCNFDSVLFTPNVAKQDDTADNLNINVTENEQLLRCKKHQNIWQELDKKSGHLVEGNTSFHSSVFQAMKQLDLNVDYDVLVTGSLHLVGAVLTILDPDLQGNHHSNINKNFENM